MPLISTEKSGASAFSTPIVNSSWYMPWMFSSIGSLNAPPCWSGRG
jgi:hypothetical protein